APHPPPPPEDRPLTGLAAAACHARSGASGAERRRCRCLVAESTTFAPMSMGHRPLSFAAALALFVSVAGCATREAPPPGVIVPPTPIGSIDASSSHWRAISRVGAPPPGTYQVEWTARGLVVLSRNGAGGIYDPYKDAWRAVVIGPGTPAELSLPAAVS